MTETAASLCNIWSSIKKMFILFANFTINQYNLFPYTERFEGSSSTGFNIFHIDLCCSFVTSSLFSSPSNPWGPKEVSVNYFSQNRSQTDYIENTTDVSYESIALSQNLVSV